MPLLPNESTWIGGDPGEMARLAAKGPVLVHFFEFSQLNGVRTLPYVNEWHRRYGQHGLRVVGVQTPRFPFGEDPAAVEAGLARLGVEFPVVIDSDHNLWASYGCEGWPSLFLWGRGGFLRWYHFGEGDYRATELAIQEQVRGPREDLELPDPVEPVRPSDAEGAKVVPPSPELFPAEGRAWTRTTDDDVFEVRYSAGGAYATLEGSGGLVLALDGQAVEPVSVDGPGLYELTTHPRHGDHSLEIALEGDVGVWSVSFAPGIP